MSGRVHSEDELGKKWDRCVTDGILKTSKLKSLIFTQLEPV